MAPRVGAGLRVGLVKERRGKETAEREGREALRCCEGASGSGDPGKIRGEVRFI